jgi:pimeloyl-ACP methyl ester carboxylesterase
MTNPVRSGANLTILPGGRWATPRDLTNPTVIFVHGFTANGSYFDILSEFFRNWGFTSLSFEYDSYVGIDVAARQLEARVRPLRAQLQNGFIIVAHSMGGLVVRRFIREFSQAPFADGLKGVCTLGTPHAGTLHDLIVCLTWPNGLIG